MAVVLCSTLYFSFAATVGAEEGVGPAVPQGWKFVLPDGDPATGETLFFERLACNSCHKLVAQCAGGI
jgi:hypothetical protein